MISTSIQNQRYFKKCLFRIQLCSSQALKEMLFECVRLASSTLIRMLEYKQHKIINSRFNERGSK